MDQRTCGQSVTATDLPPRRALYFLNPTPPPVLSQAQLDQLDTATQDPEGIALVQAIHERKEQA